VDASQSVQANLTTGDWLVIIGFFLALAGGFGMLVWTLVMKRFDDGDKRFDKLDDKLDGHANILALQGRNIARICEHFRVKEET
jgi:hypothetical protein